MFTWSNWFLFVGICGGLAMLVYAVAQETAPKRKLTKPRPQLTLIVNDRFPEGA